MNALLGTSAKRWDELTEAIDESEGAAQKMADTQLDNLAGDITLLKSAFEGLKISVSDKLTPAFRVLVQGLTWAIDHASTLGPIILGLATAFGTFAIAINIGTIIQTVTTSFAALNAVLAANPIGIVIALIVGLSVAIIALWENNETFRKVVIAVWDAIKAKISSAVDGIKYAIEGVKTAYNTVNTTFENIKKAVSDKLEAARQKVKDFIDKIKGYFPFNVGKIFTGWIPKIKLWTNKSGDKASTDSSVSHENFARAMSQPYMFKRPTEFYAGEAGDEMLYGRRALLNDIGQVVGENSNAGSIEINVYATPQQSAMEIAETVKRVLIKEVNQRRLAWA